MRMKQKFLTNYTTALLIWGNDYLSTIMLNLIFDTSLPAPQFRVTNLFLLIIYSFIIFQFELLNKKIKVRPHRLCSTSTVDSKTQPNIQNNEVESISKGAPILRVCENNLKGYRARIAANYSGKDVNVHLRPAQQTVQLCLEYEGVTLFDSNAIAMYLADEEFKGCRDSYKQSQVIQWMCYADNHLMPAVVSWVLTLPGIVKNQESSESENPACRDTFDAVDKLDKILSTKTYLVSDKLSLADVAVFTSLIPLYECIFDEDLRGHYENVSRWFLTLVNEPKIREIIGDVKLCKKKKKSTALCTRIKAI